MSGAEEMEAGKSNLARRRGRSVPGPNGPDQAQHQSDAVPLNNAARGLNFSFPLLNTVLKISPSLEPVQPRHGKRSVCLLRRY